MPFNGVRMVYPGIMKGYDETRRGAMDMTVSPEVGAEFGGGIMTALIDRSLPGTKPLYLFAAQIGFWGITQFFGEPHEPPAPSEV